MKEVETVMKRLNIILATSLLALAGRAQGGWVPGINKYRLYERATAHDIVVA